MKKNSYTDIFVYTVVILVIMILYKMEFYSYAVMEIFLVVALATFILFNFRGSIKKMLSKK